MAESIVQAKVETWEDHVEAWHHFGRVAEGAIWGRAAVAASLKGRYGEGAIEKFAGEVGLTPARIYQLAQVAEAFPENSTRVENLSFKHHLVALSAPDPAAALAKAEAEGWSARELEECVRAATSAEPNVERVEDDDWPVTITLTVPHSATQHVVCALRGMGFEGGGGSSRKMRLKKTANLHTARKGNA